MGEFLGFMVILFTFGWGSAFLLPYLRRSWTKPDQTLNHELMARLLEDIDQMATRVTQLEEEFHFFKDLHAPEEQGRLRSPDEGEEGG